MERELIKQCFFLCPYSIASSSVRPTVVFITVDGLVVPTRATINSYLWSRLYFVIYMLLAFKQFVLKISISKYIK